MSELIERARALLALREKATPVDGAVFREYDHGGGRLFVEAPQRRLILDVYHEGDRDFFFSAHKMADTIAELLAEVERLTKRLRELCEQEPVALLSTGVPWGGEQEEWEIEEYSQKALDQFCAENPGQTIPLIRRPEMPS